MRNTAAERTAGLPKEGESQAGLGTARDTWEVWVVRRKDGCEAAHRVWGTVDQLPGDERWISRVRRK